MNNIGIKLWSEAIDLIPGGNSLLSKDLRDSLLINGQLILNQLKVAQ